MDDYKAESSERGKKKKKKNGVNVSN